MEWLAKFHGLSYTLTKEADHWLKENPTFVPILQRLPAPAKAMVKGSKRNFPEKFIEMAKHLDDDNDYYGQWMTSIFDKGLDLEDLREKMQKPKE